MRFRQLIPLFFLPFVFAFPLSAQQKTIQADPPPVKETVFFVAPGGSDSYPGTLQQPLATVARAQELVRSFRQAHPQTDNLVLIVLRGGLHFLDTELTLSPSDSGTEKSLTVYEAYPGEEPILSGGRRLSGFKQTAPGRWELTIPEVAGGQWYFSQLYVNNRRARRTMLPRESYYHIEKRFPIPEDRKPDRFYYKNAPFDPTWRHLNDVEVHTFHKWTMDHLRIKEIDSVKKLVVFTGPTHSAQQAPLIPTTYYRIENVYEELKEPGQWYLDRKTGVLTVLTKPGFDLNRTQVIAPKLNRVLTAEGELGAGKYIEYVAFKGLTFAHTDWTVPPTGSGNPQADVQLDGAVTLRAVRHAVLADCIVRHTGAYGIDVGDGCSGIEVLQCELVDLGAGGIKIGPTRLGGEPDEKKWVGEVDVIDCLIAHGDRVHAEGVGVWIGHANHCTIEHNDIYDFHYSGVSVGWKWGPGFSPAHHNRIANNHIHTIGQGVIDDQAGIYTLGESPGTVLSGNHIHDVRRTNYGGWGIYFDESSRHILAENNIVHDTQDGAFHQHYGLENIVRNNIFARAENGLIAISNIVKSGTLTFERNIFYMERENLWEKDRLRDDTYFKRNLYWRKGGGPVTFFQGRDFEQWKNEREPDAVIADPGFADPDRNDFSLQTDSPAVKRIGFVPLDASKAGRLTQKNRTAPLAIGPSTFRPGVPAALINRNRPIDEDFESCENGSLYADMTSVGFKECRCVVSDKTGANGSGHSLLFREGTDHKNSWEPHLYTNLQYDAGLVTAEFDLCLGENARVSWELRDWHRPGKGDAYKTGPNFSIEKDGALKAGGKTVATLPHDTWVHLKATCPTGEGKRHDFTVTVTVPGEEPKALTVPCGEGFELATWFGFSSFGEPGSEFYVDNIRLNIQPAPRMAP